MSYNSIKFKCSAYILNPSLFQAVTIFSGPQRTDRYAAVKKMCYLDRGLNSQVVMQKNLANEKKMKTICGMSNGFILTLSQKPIWN